ncbi:MAG: Hsp20/alpha crystallin family protein [Chitinophagaceae bacterium]|jgi:HSP20 family protein|nr:Hsp20/alpha crystallin family protein [Chitinophagaceae bacterium]
MTLTKNNYNTWNNLFDELFSNASPVWAKNINMPPVNISETKDGYNVELVAPGLKKDDFKICLEKGLLTISYEKKTEVEVTDTKIHRKEFGINSFKRSFTVDENVNAEGILAKYEDGVLKLALPKKEEVKILPKEIAIQ